ncbi:MAG TPA: tetratricopeptide repeat protein, partial [Planctomycetaceae bacterium]|nr:tetratricopeptide repeat protein [Planctomycetaceae bacterium]
MALDQYGPCPCGSGKKLKFCCQPVVDLLEQAEQQLAQGQTSACRNILKQAEAKAPESPWVQVVKARCEVTAESWDAASAALRRLFELVPDHPEGLAIKVVVDVRTGKIDDIDEEIDKVFAHFERVPRHQLEMLAMLRATLPGTSPLGRQRNLMLALTLTRTENRKFVLEQAMRSMSDRSTSYLLRWDYPLRLPKENKAEYGLALKYAQTGAFISAAEEFAKLAAAAPNDADLQWDLGLCRAWNSENQLAAQALHRSAELDSDFERGSETEALAQSLDALDLSGMVPLPGWGYVVKSVSRLLTLLDQQPA